MSRLGYHARRRARQGRGRCALSFPSAMPRATTDHHPATRRGPRRPPPTPARWPAGGMIPRDQHAALVPLGDRRVTLTNLRKLFWPAPGITNGDLTAWPRDRDHVPGGAGGRRHAAQPEVAPLTRQARLDTQAAPTAAGGGALAVAD